jgi:hypothetical protein
VKSLALIIVLSACADKHAAPEVSAANDFVPADRKGELDFVMRDVDEVIPKQMWKVPAPKSWDVSQDGGRISRRHNSGSGGARAPVGSFITVSTEHCGGDCSPSPVEHGIGYQKVMHERDEDVEVDGKHLHKRIRRWLATFEGGVVHIEVKTWASDRPVFRECEARLEPDLVEAQEAFEAACVLAATY